LNRNLLIKSTYLGIKLFLLLIIYPQISGAALSSPVDLRTKVKDLVPDCILSFPLQNPGYILLVEKSTQKAYLYQASNVDNPLKVYHCSTGENKGPKSDMNDKKTPEGVYFVTKLFKEKDLSSIYGARAFPVDYPNPRDRKLGRKGYGIWIHGTTERLKPRDTNGCIVFSNEDIIELSKYIGEKHTPIIMTQKINFIKKKKLQQERAEFRGLVMNWLEAWGQSRIGLYMSFYCKGFASQGKNWRQWRAYKSRLSEKYDKIDIRIDNLQILKENGVVLAKFDQVYRSNGFFSVGEKRLYLQKKGAEWKITDEFFRKKKELVQRVPSELQREEEISVIKGLISDWHKAWQEKDLQRYMDNYSKEFFSFGLDHNGWKRNKSEINKRYAQIRVRIRNLKIKLLSSERATVYFDQEYSSDQYHDKGKKTIHLIKRDGKWKIKGEIWTPIGRGKKR
jgi:murein L,D-transpeptidase YafK